MSYRKPAPHALHALLRETFSVRRRSLARLGAAGLGALTPVMALANPSGGQVVAGSASISNPSANGTVINQGSQSAIINWQQFSVGGNQYVQFIQPSSSSVVLNRVIGANPSSIFGNITANGQVFLVNTNGIFFAPGATLDTQGLVASTLDIRDSDFMQGRYLFQKGSGAPDATVVNQGSLTAAHGGYVVLAGDYVENDGRIEAQSGRVVLAAGSSTTLTLDQNQLISYVVNGATLARLAGVDNAGSIVADGGGVLMTADVANALTATAVNNSGFVAAHSVQSQGGVIVLTAQGGDIENSGTLDASATQSGVAGGAVILRGDGTTRLDPGSVITTEGDGAAGGFVELSGHTLDVKGTMDPGRGGSLLIDPSSLTIVAGSSGPNSVGSIGVGFIDANLNAGVDVVLVASNAIGHASTVTLLQATAGAGNLTVKTGSLSVGAGSLSNISGAFGGCQVTGFCQPGSAIVFTPTSGSVNLSGMNIDIKGAFTADAQTGNVNLSKVTADGGINLTGAHITAGSLIAASGNVLITGTHQPTASTNINETGLIQGKNVTLQESLGFVSYGGSINVGNVQATAGSINIAAIALSGVRMNIHTVDLTATKAVNVNQEGKSGGISFNNVSAGANASSVGVKMQTVLVGPSAAGASIVGGNLTATGGVQLLTNGNTGSGAKVRVINVTGQYISINATAKRGADISTGILDATGTGGVSKDISLFARAKGTTPSNSHAYNASSGGNIRVTGNITGNGQLNMSARGGLDSGGSIRVSGNVNVAGKASMLAVNEGSFGGNVSVGGGITAKFVDITARAAWGGSSLRGANTNGAHVVIGGNVTATGTAPLASPSLGVNLRGGASGFSNGNPSITVHGKVTAANGAVNIFVDGRQGNRSITIGNGSSGSGTLTGQHVHIGIQNVNGSGGNIDVGAITTLGSGFQGNASIQTTGNGGNVHISVHGGITVSGTGLFINDHGNASARAINVSGPIAVNGSFGNVNIFASNNASNGGAVINTGNINATGRVAVSAFGHGAGGAHLALGILAGNSISLSAQNNGGGSAVISAGNLTAPDVNVGAFAVKGSGQAAHINLGNITAVSATGEADVRVTAAGKANTVSMGVVNVSGHSAPSICECGPGPHINPVGARFQVFTDGGASDTIAISGNLKVTALSDSSGAFGDAIVQVATYAGPSSTTAPVLVPATVGGNIIVSANRDAYVGMDASVGGVLSVKAGRNIGESVPAGEGGFGVQPNLVVNAAAVALQAGNNIDVTGGSLTAGSGAAPGVSGDTAITKLLGLGSSAAPNAAFTAGGTLSLGNLAGGANYVLIRGSLGTVGTVSLSPSTLVQLTTPTAGGTLGIGNAAGQTVYSTADINQFSGFNVVLGDSAHTGTTTVGIANLGSTAITLAGNGTIKSSGLLTAGQLTIADGAGTVTLTTNVASTTIVSGKSITVDNTAFNGTASLTVGSGAKGSVSYAFGGGVGLLGGNVNINGALTLKAKGVLDLSSMSIQAGKSVTLQAGQHILLGNTRVNAGGSFSADAHGSISNGGSAGTIVAASASFKSATGNVVLNGEALNVGAGNLAFSVAGNVAMGSANIHAGSMTVAAAGSLSLTSGNLHATKLTIITGGSIDLTGETVNVNGAVRLTAGFVSSGQALANKDIILSGISLTAGTFQASAGGTIHNGGSAGTITANGITVIAGKDINLSSTSINIGSAAAPAVTGDGLLLLGLTGVGLAPLSATPNGAFIAGGNLSLGTVNLTGSYLYLQAANVSLLGNVTVPSGTLVQVSPIDPAATIGFEDNPASTEAFNLSNLGFLSQIVVTGGGSFTLAIGNGLQTGDVILGLNGPIDIGSTNLVVETSGAVTGLGNVTSTGLVATLASLLAPPLPPPTSGEIDPNSSNNNNTSGKNKDQDLGDLGTGGTGTGGTISEDTSPETVCK